MIVGRLAGASLLCYGGAADSIVQESKDRVYAALQNRGYPFPMERSTANLVPAHLKKEEAGFDVPIAVGILFAITTPGSCLKMPAVRGFGKEGLALGPLHFWDILPLCMVAERCPKYPKNLVKTLCIIILREQGDAGSLPLQSTPEQTFLAALRIQCPHHVLGICRKYTITC
ncbi:MAG: magnesium chelatase domain-containing protein [Syntrophobacteraceae bacterium]|jgi:hypothetical protein